MKKYYQNRAHEYDKVYLKPERQGELLLIHNFIKEYFKNKNVLELACGTGYWTKDLSETANSVTSIDYNEEVLQIAKSKKYPNDNVHFQKDDIYNLTNINFNFDGAFIGFFWSHIPLAKINFFLKNLHRFLKKGTKVSVTDNVFVEGSSTPISEKDTDGNTYQIRILENGEKYKILKNFPTRNELHSLFKEYAKNLKIEFIKYFWILEYTVK